MCVIIWFLGSFVLFQIRCTSSSTPLAPSSPPTAFTCTILSDTSLRLNWRAPPVEDWNAVSLTSFRYCVVQRTPSNTFSSCRTSGSVGFQTDRNADYSRDVTGLQSLTEYLCSVSASNSQGSSPSTREISVTTSGKVVHLYSAGLG